VAAYYDAAAPTITQFRLTSAPTVARAAARISADLATAAPRGIRVRLSKPALVRVSLLRTLCARVTRRGHGVTVRVLLCLNRMVTAFVSRVGAGATTLPLTPALVAALAHRQHYLLRAQATDAPGLRSAVRTLAIDPPAGRSG